tara:strand:+ start:2496 stop:3629 length:1134 start_codon:yes stop_codon:yes gene_type:complete
MKKLSVALISNSPQTLINFKGDLIKDLNEKGYKVFVCCSDCSLETIREIESLGGIHINIYLTRLGFNFIKDLSNFKDLKNILSEIKPDYVISYFAKAIIFGNLAAFLSGIKNRFVIIEGLGYAFTYDPNIFYFKKFFLRKILSFLLKISLSRASKIFFLNQDDKDDLRKLRIINDFQYLKVLGPIGLNLQKWSFFNYKNTNRITFIFVGRLIREKGIIEYLKASKSISKTFPQVRFLVLGSKESKRNPGRISNDYLYRLLDDKNIKWIQKGDVYHYLKKSSVFVLPSYREGYPRSTQEAMAMGKPIITTNVPGCKETVKNNKNGFLIKPGSISEIENAMKFFINNPKLIQEMGYQSFLIAKDNFSSKVFNQKLINEM